LKKKRPTTNDRQRTSLFSILPIGHIPEIVIKSVAAHIQAYLNLDTDILQTLPAPDYALDRKRLQYDAAPIIERIEQESYKYQTKILGIVDADLFVPIFTHVLGEARQGGDAAVISVYRLLENRNEKVPPSPLILERTAKIALHEASHLFNLSHCMDENCLMHFSGSLDDIDSLSFYFCRYCSAYLREAMGRLKP
jgi:archaemetzincin